MTSVAPGLARGYSQKEMAPGLEGADDTPWAPLKAGPGSNLPFGSDTEPLAPPLGMYTLSPKGCDEGIWSNFFTCGPNKRHRKGMVHLLPT